MVPGAIIADFSVWIRSHGLNLATSLDDALGDGWRGWGDDVVLHDGTLVGQGISYSSSWSS